jgi:hypothetical protein
MHNHKGQRGFHKERTNPCGRGALLFRIPRKYCHQGETATDHPIVHFNHTAKAVSSRPSLGGTSKGARQVKTIPDNIDG